MIGGDDSACSHIVPEAEFAKANERQMFKECPPSKERSVFRSLNEASSGSHRSAHWE